MWLESAGRSVVPAASFFVCCETPYTLGSTAPASPAYTMYQVTLTLANDLDLRSYINVLNYLQKKNVAYKFSSSKPSSHELWNECNMYLVKPKRHCSREHLQQRVWSLSSQDHGLVLLRWLKVHTHNVKFGTQVSAT